MSLDIVPITLEDFGGLMAIMKKTPCGAFLGCFEKAGEHAGAVILAAASTFTYAVMLAVEALRVAFVLTRVRLIFDRTRHRKNFASFDRETDPHRIAIRTTALNAGELASKFFVRDIARRLQFNRNAVKVAKVFDVRHVLSPVGCLLQ